MKNTDPKTNRTREGAQAHPEQTPYNHTPGPWYITPSGHAVCTEEGTIITRGFHHEIQEPAAIAANARLIAAAPELYQVLGELINIADNPDQNDLNDFINEGIFAHTRDLLAQVRGEGK